MPDFEYVEQLRDWAVSHTGHRCDYTHKAMILCDWAEAFHLDNERDFKINRDRRM